MKKKIIVLVFVALVVATISTTRMKSRSNQERLSELQNSPERGTLDWYAQMAAAKGERSVVLESPIPNLDVVTSLNEALSNYLVIRAQPIAIRSHVKDKQSIWTWYKFRIMETFSQSSLAKPSNALAAPEDLVPGNPDELLLDYEGGSQVINGISVVQRPHGILPFLASKQYILFLAPDASGNGFRIPLGPSGVLIVHNDGSLESASRQTGDLLPKEIGNSLARFREAVEARRNTR
jgi:hypothetical protein